MKVETVDRYDYDALRSCPFCLRAALLGAGDCGHFVTAFEEGTWAPHICSPVFCDGFLFRRDELTAMLNGESGVVCKKKAGTTNHPAIEAYFCSEPGLVAALRKKYRKVAVQGAVCGDCGTKIVVLDDASFVSCAVCGAPSYLRDPENQPA